MASRMSSFSIKCSMCAQDIEISLMGEHVCAIIPESTPPPETDRTFENNLDAPESKKGSGLLKPRVPLARVDTAAANRPFIRPDQLHAQPLTPVSASSSYRTLSPSSAGGKTPYGSQLPRSATAPPPLKIPSPSEILSGNYASAKDTSKQNRGQNGDFFGTERNEEPGQYAPLSPRPGPSGGLLQRMNTIAPGPFDISARASQRTLSSGNVNRDADLEGRPRTSHKPQASVGSYMGERKLSSDGPKRPRDEKPGGYGGFGPPPSRNGEPIKSPIDVVNRSQTFPKENKNIIENDETRRSSATPPSRPRRPSAGPDLSRSLPPQGASLIGSRDERRLTEARSVPGVDLASEFGVSNPYHTASESQSSTASGASLVSNVSSRSSPPSSTSGSRRKPSNTSNIDMLMNDIESSMTDLRPKELPSTLKSLKLEPQAKEQYGRNMSPLQSNPGSFDPAVQVDRISPASSRPISPAPPLQRPVSSKDTRRPATAKGNCRGCSLPIKGKSVSSADGRLTGRYHKSCFVCKTCSEPFATTSFYVLDDAPYCERHYHKLNNSMCHSCDRGIEGQYLETERSKKYHPHCLQCCDCKRILKQDYFEMNARVYCERDAFRRAQQRNFLGPGSATRMERRTTRLMMM